MPWEQGHSFAGLPRHCSHCILGRMASPDAVPFYGMQSAFYIHFSPFSNNHKFIIFLTILRVGVDSQFEVNREPNGEGNGTPLQYSCLEKSYGRRSLVGCSP